MPQYPKNAGESRIKSLETSKESHGFSTLILLYTDFLRCCDPSFRPKHHSSRKMKLSTTILAALFLQMTLTDQRIAMVDMIWLVCHSPPRNDTTPKSLPCFRLTAKQNVGVRYELLESCYGDQSAEQKLGSAKALFLGKVYFQKILESPRLGKQQKEQSNHLREIFQCSLVYPYPSVLISREDTQTMVREKLCPKPRPPQTLHLPGNQTMVRVSGEGKLRPWSEFGVFLGRGRRGGSTILEIFS